MSIWLNDLEERYAKGEANQKVSLWAIEKYKKARDWDNFWLTNPFFFEKGAVTPNCPKCGRLLIEVEWGIFGTRYLELDCFNRFHWLFKRWRYGRFMWPKHYSFTIGKYDD